MTIGQALMDSFPKLFEEAIGDDGNEVVEMCDPKMELLTQGVPIDLKTQLYWMQMNLCYPDGFLYISFHFRNE